MSKFTLPSGLTGEVRGLSGRDGRYLTNQKLIQDNEVEDFILKHCWTSTIDEGPYTIGGEVDWSKILIGDRVFMLCAVRVESYPDEPYPITVRCPSCNKPVQWEIDVDEFLKKKVKKLAAEDAKAFKEGNRITEKLPYDGRRFVFKLKTGGDAKRFQARLDAKANGTQKQKDRQNVMVDAICDSIVEIEGVSSKYDERFDFFEGLPMRSIDATLALMQSHDCGIETSIEIECRRMACQTTFEVDLPFSQRAFFLPSISKARGSSVQETPAEQGGEAETPDPFG